MFKLKTVITTSSLLVLSALNAFAAPWSEKNAFCTQRRNPLLSSYESQKAYNNCMKNADQLIQEYENEQRRERANLEKIRRQQVIQHRQRLRQEEINREKLNDYFGGYNIIP